MSIKRVCRIREWILYNWLVIKNCFHVRDVIYMMYEEIQKIKHLREVTFVMVEESSNGIECTKNRFGNRTMECCKNIEFEKIELSKIDNDIPKIRKEYYGKNLWVML